MMKYSNQWEIKRIKKLEECRFYFLLDKTIIREFRKFNTQL